MLPHTCYTPTRMNWVGDTLISGNHGCSDHEIMVFSLLRGVTRASIDELPDEYATDKWAQISAHRVVVVNVSHSTWRSLRSGAIQAPVLRPILFNFLYQWPEGQMEYTHKDNSELSRAVTKLQQQAAIHKDLHRLIRTSTKPNHTLHLGWTSL